VTLSAGLVAGEVRWTRQWQVFRQWPRRRGPRRLPRRRWSSQWSTRRMRRLRRLLINCEEDRPLRAVLVGIVRETERSGPP